MKYFDYYFKTAIIIICIVFLILFYNFTKNKHIKIEMVSATGSNCDIFMDNLKNDEKCVDKMK